MTTYNSRGAGRKKALSDEQIKKLRERHNSGETISSLAKEVGVSRQTLSAYIGNSLIEPSTYVCVAGRETFTPSVVSVEG